MAGSTFHFSTNYPQNYNFMPRLNMLRNHEKCYTKLHLYLNNFGGWTHVTKTLLVSFISKSKSLKHLHISVRKNSDENFDLLRECVIVAESNPSISNISLAMHLDGTPFADIAEALEMVGKTKVKEIQVELTDGESMNENDFKMMNCAIASWEKIQTIRLFDLRDEMLEDLMTKLVKRKSPSEVTKIDLNYSYRTRDYVTKLPGIDAFLECASSLDSIDVHFRKCSGVALRRMASGFAKNTSIKKLNFSAREITIVATKALANIILQAPSNLRTLRINLIGATFHFQDVILRALYSNETIGELTLEEGFYDKVSCKESVSNLLARNSKIEIFECNSEFNIDSSWIRHTAEGLKCNSTLKELSIFNFLDETVDVGPLFDALLPNDLNNNDPRKASKLRKLRIEGLCVRGSQQTLSRTLSSPSCPLKELLINAYNSPDDLVLQALSAAQISSSLRKLSITTWERIRPETWIHIASILGSLPILDLKIEYEDGFWEEGIGIEEEESVARNIEGLLEKSMHINKTLEKVSICTGYEFDDPKFQSKVQEYCNRNVAIKASNAIAKHASVSNLPLSAMPAALKTLDERCLDTTPEQCLDLSGTILFAALQSRCHSSDLWESIIASSSLEDATRQRKTIVQEDLNNAPSKTSKK